MRRVSPHGPSPLKDPKDMQNLHKKGGTATCSPFAHSWCAEGFSFCVGFTREQGKKSFGPR